MHVRLQLLLDHYAELPQPDGDVALADAYRAAGDLRRAVEFYERVSSQYPTGEAASRSAAALATLEAAMGASLPWIRSEPNVGWRTCSWREARAQDRIGEDDQDAVEEVDRGEVAVRRGAGASRRVTRCRGPCAQDLTIG